MKQLMSNKQNGFTLIELVIVIVILGILAATAAPKFIDLSSDAKKATMKGLAGAMASAADLVFYKSKIPGYVSSDKKTITFNSTTVDITEGGYPEASPENNDLGIIDLIDFDDDWLSDTSSQGDDNASIGYDLTEDDGCYVKYTEGDSDGGKYKIETILVGC